MAADMREREKKREGFEDFTLLALNTRKGR